MAYDRGYINGPIGISDIIAALGASDGDLGTLCKHPNINRWAIYKPQQFAGVAPITLAQRKSKNMGLQPVSINALKDTSGGIAKHTIEEVESSIREWDYLRPTGGSTSIFRISDFIDETKPESLGYNHNAVACDSGWGDSEKAKPSSSRDLGVLVTGFSFRLDQTSASNIGADSNFMPLSFVVPNVNNWYLGIAVYIPSQNGWLYMRGEKSLTEATTSSEVLPTAKTNEWLQDLMYSGSGEYTYVPCILVNPQTNRIVEQAQRTYISMAVGQVYCMPSGAKSHKIRLNVAIKNTSKQFVFEGVTVWGNYLSDQYIVSLPVSNETMAYLIKGYVDTATGRTLGGWFITSITDGAAAYGFYNRKIVVMYADTIAGSNRLDYTATPRGSISVDEYLYCKYLEDLNPNGNTHYVYYGYTLKTGALSTTDKVTTNNNGKSVSFYGYVTTQVKPGLVVDCVR